MTRKEIVQSLWKYMQEKYDSEVVDKDDSVAMKAVAIILNALKIQDKETFMKKFTTTIDRAIYTPFEIGVETQSFSYWSQIAICVHEHQHIEQSLRVGWFTFMGKYLASSSDRACYEAEAYGCDLEMLSWANSQDFNFAYYIDRCCSGLTSYGCNEEDIIMAKQILSARADLISQGTIETQAAKLAIKWLENNPDAKREFQVTLRG